MDTYLYRRFIQISIVYTLFIYLKRYYYLLECEKRSLEIDSEHCLLHVNGLEDCLDYVYVVLINVYRNFNDAKQICFEC